MDERQFDLLHEELVRLCGAPDPEGVFSFRSIQFQFVHGSGSDIGWADLVVNVLKLSECDAMEAMSMALASNYFFLETPSPRWFALSPNGPSIALIQRLYSSRVQASDLFKHLGELDERSMAMRHAIRQLLVDR